MKKFLKRQSGGTKKPNEDDADSAQGTDQKQGKRGDKPMDAKRMGDLIAVKNGLKNNVPGTIINGNPLIKPLKPYRNPKLHEDEEKEGSPEVKELDVMF